MDDLRDRRNDEGILVDPLCPIWIYNFAISNIYVCSFFHVAADFSTITPFRNSHLGFRSILTRRSCSSINDGLDPDRDDGKHSLHAARNDDQSRCRNNRTVKRHGEPDDATLPFSHFANSPRNSALGPHDTRLSSSLCSAQRNGHLKPIKHEPILSTILFRLLFLLSLFPLLFSFFLNSFFGRGDYAMTITRKRRTHFAHSQNVVDKRGCTRAITTQ